jgi:hypothetical protein
MRIIRIIRIISKLFVFGISLLSLLSVLLLSGCTPEKLPDMDYLRADASRLKTYVREGRSFMPQNSNATWRYYVQGQALQQDTMGQTKEAIITSQYREEQSLLPSSVQGDRTLYPMTRRVNGKVREGEVFQEKAEGLFLQKGLFLYSTKAEEAIMEMEPPMTLVQYPMQEGELILWSGNLRYQGNLYPARGASRMTRKETIKTAQGQFDAYRIDTRIYSVDLQTAYTLTMRWFVPERGMMRLRMVRPKEILDYNLAK